MANFSSPPPSAVRVAPPSEKLASIISLVLLSIVTICLTLGLYEVWVAPAWLLLVVRWALFVSVTGYALLRKDITTWILASMVIGAVIGYDFPDFSKNLKVVSDIFLKLIKTVIAPLLIGTLVVGIAGHSDMKQVGRMGWKSLVYFEIVTTLALFVGLAAINISQAGAGIDLSKAGEQKEKLATIKEQTWQDIVLHIFPENIAKSIAQGEILQIVVFSIIFAIALSMVADKHKQVMLSALESLSEIMFKFTNVIMYFAPFAVGAAIAYTLSAMGLGIFVNLFKLLITLYVSLIAFVLLVLLPIAWFMRVPLLKFWRAAAEPVSIAFATSTSEAALPKAMRAMESIGVPRKIVAFVIPTGYSFNLDGTTLYLALAAIFVAQAAGVDLSLGTQLLIVFTLMLTSKGVAGVPRASLVILSGTVASFGLPAEPIAIILGIDALMDMARTSVNVLGNCLATVVIAKWENEFDENANPDQEPDILAEAAANHWEIMEVKDKNL